MQAELDRLVTALQEFYARETFLLERDLGERTLTHRLAVCLERQYPGWEVDCDYNRLGERTLVYARLCDGAAIVAEDAGLSRARMGDEVALSVEARAAHLFDADGNGHHPAEPQA